MYFYEGRPMGKQYELNDLHPRFFLFLQTVYRLMFLGDLLLLRVFEQNFYRMQYEDVRFFFKHVSDSKVTEFAFKYNTFINGRASLSIKYLLCYGEIILKKKKKCYRETIFDINYSSL